MGQYLSSAISDDRLFSELGTEYYEKQSKRSPQNWGKILFLFQHQIAENLQLLQRNHGSKMVKSMHESWIPKAIYDFFKPNFFDSGLT